MRRPEPIQLEGSHVRLVPLTRAHVPDLCAVGLDAALWEWSAEHITTAAAMATYVDRALAAQAAGTEVPFTVLQASDGRVVGSTRYGNIAVEHGRLEIGWTWYGLPWQRTVVNTACKLLLLRHAFEALEAYRVEFKTDARNARSRAALVRIGAREEGELRAHMVAAGGRRRDTVYYSLLQPEWPAVRRRLEHWLEAPR